MSFIHKTKNRNLIGAYTTIGVDEAGLLMRFKITKKTNVTKAIFNKKQFRYKHPPLQWDQKYKKLKI